MLPWKQYFCETYGGLDVVADTKQLVFSELLLRAQESEYQCLECYQEFDDEDSAKTCHSGSVRESYYCPICGDKHTDEDGSVKCCVAVIKYGEHDRQFSPSKNLEEKIQLIDVQIENPDQGEMI